MRLISTHPAAFSAVTLLTAAMVLWLAPWPIDALLAGTAAAGWTSWLEQQDPS